MVEIEVLPGVDQGLEMPENRGRRQSSLGRRYPRWAYPVPAAVSWRRK